MSGDQEIQQGRLTAPTWLLLCLAFLTAASAHGCLILYYGSSLPYGDEWDGIGLRLFLPYLQHRFSLNDLFAAHNEHRIVLTRLQSLTVLVISGRWDLVTEMALNCVWYGLAVAALVAAQLRSENFNLRRWAPLFTIAVFSLPFAWQNTVWGFQSQNYFALLFAMIVLWAESERGTGPVRWWIGMGACLLSLFSNAAGVFTATSILIVYIALCLSRKMAWRKIMPTLVVIGAIVSLGVFLHINVPAHEYLKAKTLSVFFSVLGSCLAWPSIDQPMAAMVMYLPLFFFSLSAFRQNRLGLNEYILVWMLTLLGLFNAVSIAYARGNGLPEGAPLSRYQEMLALGAVGNACALLLLKPAEATSKAWRGWLLLCLIWCSLFFLGSIRLSMVNFNLHLPLKAAVGKSETALLSSYARTHDKSMIDGRPSIVAGHPDARVIEQVIDSPDLLPHLPTALQIPSKPTAIESASLSMLRLSPVFLVLSSLALVLASLFGVRRTQQLN